MYHVPHDVGPAAAQYNYNDYRENRRSTPSYALVPHSSTNGRRIQYTASRYHTQPVRYRSESRYHSGPTRYSSEPRLYGGSRDSRDHVETYQEQRYVIPYNSNTHSSQYRESRSTVNRNSGREEWATRRYSSGHGQPQKVRTYQYRREEQVPVCACVIS